MQLDHNQKGTKLPLILLLLVLVVVSNSKQSDTKSLSLQSNQNIATNVKSSQQSKHTELSNKSQYPTVQDAKQSNKERLAEIQQQFGNSFFQKIDNINSAELSSNNFDNQGSEQSNSHDQKQGLSSEQSNKQNIPVTVNNQIGSEKKQKFSQQNQKINSQKQEKTSNQPVSNKVTESSSEGNKQNTQNIKKQKQYQIGDKIIQTMKFQHSNRTVFDCFPYNGQDHLLLLRFLVMSQFVDYFVIVQSQYTYTGMKKQLVFDINRFKDYSHKIIYFTLSTFPNIGTGHSNKEHWENNHYQRNSYIPLLKQRAKPEDIIFLSDIDEILSKYGFAQYDPQLYPWAVAEMRHYYYYFNRASVFDYNGEEQIINYWYNGIRITTFETIMDSFEGNMVKLRRSRGCITADLSSKIIKKVSVQCQGPILRQAGWHFSYVLNDVDLAKKVKSIADGDIGTTIFDYQYQRASSPAPQAYLKDFQLQDADLPMQLVVDILKNKQRSIFAPYIAKVVPNQMCDEGQIQKGTNKDKQPRNKKKTRIILNLDPAQRNGKELKKIQCIKIEEVGNNQNQNYNLQNFFNPVNDVNEKKNENNNLLTSDQSQIKNDTLQEGLAKQDKQDSNTKTIDMWQKKAEESEKQTNSQWNQNLGKNSKQIVQALQKEQVQAGQLSNVQAQQTINTETIEPNQNNNNEQVVQDSLDDLMQWIEKQKQKTPEGNVEQKVKQEQKVEQMQQETIQDPAKIIRNQQIQKNNGGMTTESNVQNPVVYSQTLDPTQSKRGNSFLSVIFVILLFILLVIGVHKTCKYLECCFFERRINPIAVQSSNHRNYLPVDFD